MVTYGEQPFLAMFRMFVSILLLVETNQRIGFFIQLDINYCMTPILVHPVFAFYWKGIFVLVVNCYVLMITVTVTTAD